MNKTESRWPLNFRQLYLIVWLICYLLIILIYLLAVTEDGTITFNDDIKPLLLNTSAVIVPQLIIMLIFFFSKSRQQIDSIIRKTIFSTLAYAMSLTYIIIFVALVYLGIKIQIIPGDNLKSINKMILTIMLLLSILSNGPIAYLFGKKVKDTELTS